ncbi:MAG: lamin tail domain-containing protein [Clostridia bacterium]|nr:lamin tail domain-containing protein [Clostridia bacterium]
MSKIAKNGATGWHGMTPHISTREWLRAFVIIAAIALTAWAGALYSPRDSLAAVDLPIVINRLMTSNPSACFGLDGKYYDWLELKNISGETISLDGWRLGCSFDLREARKLDGLKLAPGATQFVYCDRIPVDCPDGAFFSGFRLSANGEQLVLTDPQHQMSILIVPQLAKANVYQRDEATGSYTALTLVEALGSDYSYARTLTPDYDPQGLMISEIMPVNHSTLKDEDGDFSDWLELYNGTGAPVDLNGYALSDDDANHLKWRFPSRVMQPGEYLVVFASGKDRSDPDGELHANFRLSGKGEAIRLYDPKSNALSYVQYSSVSADISLSRQSDGGITQALDPSPGAENTEFGMRTVAAVPWDNPTGIFINEVLASNSGTDWIEIANTSGSAVDLSGMGLSDDPSHPRKWQFPNGAQIGAGGYLVVALAGNAEAQAKDAAKGKNQMNVNADYTADFALSDRETVCLSTPDGRLLDRTKLYGQRRDISYGRAAGQDRFRFFPEPTPGQANSGRFYQDVARNVTFSVPPGFVHESRIELAMASDPGVNIYYTLDGSTPTLNSDVYTKPISISRNTIVRAIAWRQGVLQSETSSGSFIFADHSVRLVCVYGNQSQLIGSEGTLVTGARKNGYNVYAEVYEPDGTKLVGQNCHMILTGHHSRTHYDQKSFRLTAKRNTGDTRFRAALFSKRDYSEYKSFMVRASGQDVMQTKMRDSILTSLAADTSLLYQETELCVLYVNGQYWGVYNMRERIDEHSICQFEGWNDPDGVVLGEGNGNSAPGYRDLLRWVRNHDLSDDSNIEALRKKMDIENYLDYVAMEIYCCNQDLNNVRFYCSPKEDPRWKWALFDLDLSYQIDRNNVNDWLKNDKAGTITSQETTIFVRLMKNAGMRDYFLKRMGQLLSTTLSAENVVGRIKERYALMAPEMKANCERWNWSVGTWTRYVKKMAKYAQGRPRKLAGYLSDTFDLSKAEEEKYFGNVK